LWLPVEPTGRELEDPLYEQFSGPDVITGSDNLNHRTEQLVALRYRLFAFGAVW
jgi:hypothetical protein